MGFGSAYYVDFVMFHKYLFIENMVCVEWSEIPKRMRFNKPFNFIKLRMQLRLPPGLTQTVKTLLAVR